MTYRKIGTAVCVVAVAVAVAVVLAACAKGQPTESRAQRHIAEDQNSHTIALHKDQPAYFPTYSDEMKNVNERNARFSDPNLVGYVAVLTQQGGVIYNGTIKGKVSSTDSQVTPKDYLDCEHYGDRDPRPDGCGVVSLADPDGSWSTNGGGVFWYDANNHIHEAYGNPIVMYSDAPQTFTTPPILTINADAANKVVENRCDTNGANCK